jgi:hypothetical protein
MTEANAIGGLTVEDVNAIQDEMNKIGEDDGSDAAAAEAKADEDAKLAEAKAAEDKAKADADAKVGDDSKAKEDDKGDDKDADDKLDVIRELKEQNRQTNEALKKITSDYQKLHKIMLDKGVISEEEDKASKDEQEALQAAYAERQNKLNEMVAIMELNPNYADVRDVCTQGNLDDIIDAFSRYYVKENGGSTKEVAARMESEIWQEVNPYKKIYELVKRYHPRYAKADEVGKDDAAKKAEADAKKLAAEADGTKGKKPVDTTPSAANIGSGGSGAGSGGWTAAKIDALDEDELSTVPKDIYDKYLANQLN